jgi:CRISPR-associated protein Csm1
LEANRSQNVRTASAHQKTEITGLLKAVLLIADRLSSGSEGIKDKETGPMETNAEGRLSCIFDEVELIDHKFTPPGRTFYNLFPLEAKSEAIFPQFGLPSGPPEEYAAHFEKFQRVIRKIKTDVDYKFYIDGLISVLEKYTWCIPSTNSKAVLQTSLFDHAFSSAGIAQALYLYHHNDGSVPQWTDRENKFLMVGGDLSGIQDYIFGISRNSGRGVSKIFRARSFFLQAVTRSILIEIQNRFGLYSVCRVMDSGGKFILLLPGIDGVKSGLEDLYKNIQLWFREKFKGKLTFVLAWSTAMAQRDFYLSNFQVKLDAVNEALNKAKYQKLDRTIADKGPIIEKDYEEDEGGNCSLCGINASDNAATRKYQEKENLITPRPVCIDCCEQIVYIGTRLPRTNYFVYGSKGKIPLLGSVRLSLSHEAPSDLENIQLVETLEDTGNFARVRLARHLPVITEEELADNNWFDLFETEEDQILQVNQPKTFNLIAKKSKKTVSGKLIGRELLGFLKADVDNLGLIFTSGLSGCLSADRFISVSRMLNFFFADYMVALIQETYPDVYVVFAGGDDLFLVGPWWQILKCASTIREKFSLYCGHNEDISMSAGILFAKPRLPMRKAADLVESKLETAKSHASENRIKDSIHILGTNLGWKEIESLLKIGETFSTALIEKERTKFSMAFMYRLYHYHQMYLAFIYEKKLRFGRYLSLAHYDIGRNLRSEKIQNEHELQLLNRIFAVGAAARSELETLNVPLFYAINLNRDKT